MSIFSNLKRLKIDTTRLFIRSAALGGLVLAIIGPFILLTRGGREFSSLPWHLWIITPLLLALTIGAGTLMFRHVSHASEEISINPDQRKIGRNWK